VMRHAGTRFRPPLDSIDLAPCGHPCVRGGPGDLAAAATARHAAPLTCPLFPLQTVAPSCSTRRSRASSRTYARRFPSLAVYVDGDLPLPHLLAPRTIEGGNATWTGRRRALRHQLRGGGQGVRAQVQGHLRVPRVLPRQGGLLPCFLLRLLGRAQVAPPQAHADRVDGCPLVLG
jgi:hypothetical protein